MEIGMAFDQNYLTPAFVLMTSIFKNNSCRINFHIITEDLNDVDRNALAKYAKDNNCTTQFYTLSEMPGLHVPKDSYYSRVNYYRLFFPHLLKIDRLLYLDVDMVVIKDLTELYNTNIEDYSFAAVKDPYFVVRYDLGLTDREQYFNTGVLLMNLPEWRQQKITELSLKYAKANPGKLLFVDQDALNAVVRGKWFHLDKRYNLTRGDTRLQTPTKLLLKNTVIVHYNTSEKPWHKLARNKLRFLYHYYLRLSPVKSKKYTDTGSFTSFLRIRLKEKYFDLRLNKILRIHSWENIRYDY